MIRRRGGVLLYRDSGSAPEASRQLEREGFAHLPGILDAQAVAELGASINEVFNEWPADRRAPRSAELDEHFR